MNPNRLRPTGVKREDLDVWFSGIVNDAIRDVSEAGMPSRELHQLLKTITDMNHPLGETYGYKDSYRYKDSIMATKHNTTPATLFDIRALDNKSKGTLLIADFNTGRDPAPCYMATLAPPPLAAVSFAPPNEYRTQSAAVRAMAAQVKCILDQLIEIAGTLEAKEH